jgi:MFS family permease
MVKSHVEESLGANPGDAALNPADSVAMGVPASRAPGTPVVRSGMFGALRHRPFRLLFISFLINQTGFWISHISLQGLMVELTDNDTRQSGLLFFWLFMPAFLLAPLAGVAADRFDRKRIVLVCYAAIALACAALSGLTAAQAMTPRLLLLVAFAMGTSFAFSGPASLAIAANSVPSRDLPSAVSLQSAANNLTRVVGPLIAAPLVAGGRFEISFGLYLAAALTAGGLTAAMRIQRYQPDEEETGIFARMANGLAHAHARQPALPALSAVAVLSFFGVSHTVLLPVYAQEVLGSREQFAWLAAATGVGAMAGALWTGRAKGVPNLRVAAVQLCAYGLALALFARSESLVPALIMQAIIGYFYFAVMTSLQTLIQQIVDEAKRGRVMSLFQVCWAGLVPFGSLMLGFAASPLGTAGAMQATALVCIGYGAALTLLARRWRSPLEELART